MTLDVPRAAIATLAGRAEQLLGPHAAALLRRFDLTQHQLQSKLLTLAEELGRAEPAVQQGVMDYLRRGARLGQLAPEAQRWVGRIYPELAELSRQSLAAIGPPTSARSTKGIAWTLPETAPSALSPLPPLYQLPRLLEAGVPRQLARWRAHVVPTRERVEPWALRVSPPRSPFELPPSIGAAFSWTTPGADIQDAPTYLKAFAHGAGRRLAGAQVFGRDFKELNRLLEQVPPEDASKVRGLLTAFFQPPSDPTGAQQALGTMMSLQAGLSLSGIGPILANSSQVFWIGVVNGFRNLAKGLSRYLSDPAYRQQIRELAEVPYVSAADLHELLGVTRTSPSVDRFVKLLLKPFMAVESKLVARAGLLAADATLDELRRRPASPEIIRRLQRLGLSNREISALATGQADRDLLTYARLGLADDAVFFPTRSRRPSLAAHHPILDAAFQFKGFAINLGRLVYRHVLEEARLGNYRPLARMLAGVGIGGTAAGEIIRDVQALLSGRQRPVPEGRNMLLRLLENVSAVGGVGIASDLLLRLLGSNNPSWALSSFLLGPVVSNVVQAGGALVGAATAPAYENPRERAYSALRQIARSVGGPLDIGDWLTSPTGPLPDPTTHPALRPSLVGPSSYVSTVLGLSPEARLMEQARRARRAGREYQLPYRLRQ